MRAAWQRAVAEKVMCWVSMRDFADAVETFGAGYGVCRSLMSRHWAVASATGWNRLQCNLKFLALQTIVAGHRKTVPFSLPPDLDAFLRQEAKRTGQSIAHVIRRGLGVGVILQDDSTTLARAVRNVYKRPTEYPISVKIALRESCEATMAAGPGAMLPGDATTIEGYIRRAGPYQVGPSHWAYGPLTRKERGDGFELTVPGEPELERQRVVVQHRNFPMKPAPIELDGRLFWVYTNVDMDARATRVFQENITTIWSDLALDHEDE